MANTSTGLGRIACQKVSQFLEAIPHPDSDQVRRFAVQNGLSKEHVEKLVRES
jgi:hypothetical protein